MTRGLIVSVMAAVVLLSGCHSVDQKTEASELPSTVPTLTATEEQAVAFGNLLYELGAAALPEPESDVSQGLYLGRISAVRSEAGRTFFDVDFASAQMEPGTTKAQRQKSSWPDYYGWNHYPHVQRVVVDDGAGFVIGWLEMNPVDLDQFVEEWNSFHDPGEALYYIALGDGEVVAAYPWVP